jgi:hypothetical protein
MKMPCLFIGFLIPIVSLFAQMPNVKFGEVTNSDFENNIYSIDSNAHAIVLYDACKAKYYGDNKGGFNIEYTYHRRIRLLNKNAFDQLATINIYLYKGSGSFEDKMSKINAATYNFENGLVKKSNVEKSAIFKDKVSKTFQVQKFTFPNLSEGCIIEYTYTIISPFERNLRAHQFQENYPVLWSQYDVTIPALYEYVIIKTGQHPYTIEKTEIEEGQYNIRNSGGSEKDEVYSYKTNDYHTTFAMKNVTAIKKENFTSSLSNHLAKIEFQLSATNYPNEPRKDILRTWYQVADELLKDENFGKLVSEKNGWLDDEIKKNNTPERNRRAECKGYL